MCTKYFLVEGIEFVCTTIFYFLFFVTLLSSLATFLDFFFLAFDDAKTGGNLVV